MYTRMCGLHLNLIMKIIGHMSLALRRLFVEFKYLKIGVEVI